MSKQEAIEHLIEQLLEGDGFTVNWLVYTFETDILPDLHDSTKHRGHYHAVMGKIAKGIQTILRPVPIRFGITCTSQQKQLPNRLSMTG